jgi:hypothetical protein
MGWLLSTQDANVATVAGAGADTAAEAEPEIASVELATVGANPAEFEGQQIAVSEVPVASVLGSRGFWADVPGANPVLVILGAAVPDASWLAVGASPSVVATVEPVTEEVLDSWIQGQVLVPDARNQAAFATHYLQVSQATP